MSMMVALFLIVIVASLAAFAVTLGVSQREQVNLQLLGSRALEAARTGNEWAAYRAVVNNSCIGTTSLNLIQGSLNGFRVTIACSRTPHILSGLSYNVYDITSFAQYGRFGAVDYVSKTATARVTNAPP
jgi:MSHA biogenesis protein MshP